MIDNNYYNTIRGEEEEEEKRIRVAGSDGNSVSKELICFSQLVSHNQIISFKKVIRILE